MCAVLGFAGAALTRTSQGSPTAKTVRILLTTKGTSMETKELTSSKDLLLDILGVSLIPGKKIKCPFPSHVDRRPSFQIYKKDGVWRYRCWSRCGAGNLFDAVGHMYGLTSFPQQKAKIKELCGIDIVDDNTQNEPILSEAALPFVEECHATLMKGSHPKIEYHVQNRGLALDKIAEFSVGFMDNKKFVGRRGSYWGWSLPVENHNQKIVAIKLHLEQSPFPWRPFHYSKGMWAPFGTWPHEDPKHGCVGLFPAPERFPRKPDHFVICPGELKALAVVSCGLPATSPTTGESTPLNTYNIKRIADVQAKFYVIQADDDTEGRKWAERTRKALKKVGLDAGVNFLKARPRRKK